jgi:hypothetical protein
MRGFWSEQVETEIVTPLPSRLRTGSQSRWSDLCTRTIWYQAHSSAECRVDPSPGVGIYVAWVPHLGTRSLIFVGPAPRAVPTDAGSGCEEDVAGGRHPTKPKVTGSKSGRTHSARSRLGSGFAGFRGDRRETSTAGRASRVEGGRVRDQDDQ